MRGAAMKSLIVGILFLVLVPFTAYCQEKNAMMTDADGIPYSLDKDGAKVYLVVEYPPEFPGGMNKLMKQISKASRCVLKSGHGKVYISFTVDSSGFIKKGSVIFIKGENIANECQQKIASNFEAFPQSKPGRLKSNEAVPVRFTVPINY
ncbi:hypothetical protein BH09BAC3_BH09BAC3_30480 [soil metagenome]